MKAAVLICLLLFVQLGSALLIGAFNIKSFGKTKAENPKVLKIITVEVRDEHLNATDKLMEAVNNGGSEYGHTVREPLGSGSYKERYLFIYRKKSASVVNSFTYPDTKNDFSRPPFVVMFCTPPTTTICADKQKFVLILLHSAPTDAVKEVDALHNVVLDTKKRWRNNNILLLGDFNAGGTYIKPEYWRKIRLRTDPDYHWLIPDTAVTSVICTCPYDRIVATIEMNAHVVPGSAEVYKFDEKLGLDKTEAAAVSNHYPVQVQLNSDDHQHRAYF